jgi:L-arabinokinase
MPVKRVLFYVTGHGLGHATRTITVVNELVSRAPDVLPLINTLAPEWVFQRQVTGDFEYHRCENDVGAVQEDFWHVDTLETLKRYARFMDGEAALVAEQAAFVKRHSVAAVVSDIPAAAFTVARRAGVPSFGISNFSWDWIFAPYAEAHPEYRFVVDHLRECYGQADRFLRLPFHGDAAAFAKVEDIPLVARRATLSRDDVLGRLNLDPQKKIILLYLGGFDCERALSDEMRQRTDCAFVSAEAVEGVEELFLDLLAAADAVVAKPGYGTVSDCIANRTPILYTSRDDFLEYDALVAGIERYAHGRPVPRDKLLAGRWADDLDALLATGPEWPEFPINGAAVAAKRVLEVI